MYSVPARYLSREFKAALRLQTSSTRENHKRLLLTARAMRATAHQQQPLEYKNSGHSMPFKFTNECDWNDSYIQNVRCQKAVVAQKSTRHQV